MKDIGEVVWLIPQECVRCTFGHIVEMYHANWRSGFPQERLCERMVKQMFFFFLPPEVVEEIGKVVETFPQERCHHGIMPKFQKRTVDQVFLALRSLKMCRSEM